MTQQQTQQTEMSMMMAFFAWLCTWASASSCLLCNTLDTSGNVPLGADCGKLDTAHGDLHGEEGADKADDHGNDHECTGGAEVASKVGGG